MIHLNDVSLAFGGQQVLDDLSWHIKKGRRIGLVGPNGTGKSTLLRVIAGQQRPDAGTISMASTTTVGYLAQNVQEGDLDRSVLQEAMEAFQDVLALEQQVEEITDALHHEPDHESDRYLKLLHALEDAQAQLNAREAHRIQARSETVLAGLGFEPEDMERALSTFSGGWRMRVVLARMLLRQPDVLLLDEPTNHLDIESIDWLETYLKGYNGTVVLVSHDRYFLDRMVDTTAELLNGKVIEYAGNYTFYLQDRQLRRELQQNAYENQQKLIADTEKFIERFRYKATKAVQVQSRIKQLEKLERVPPPPVEAAVIHFRFPAPPQSGRTVLELSTFSKSYHTPEEGEIRVFDSAGPLKVERGDKLALIGKNGAGKSTLARILLGTEPFEGTRTLGHNVTLTYFAQHQAESLDTSRTILAELQAHARGQTETQVRAILGAFLFTGDDVFKPIGVLSGGERSRVALARTLLVPANFMILDEPTNHLDMQSIAVLVEALRQYTGTFVVVSHDRHFLDQIVNKVWHVSHGHVQEFIGNYTDYHWQVEHGTRREGPAPPGAADGARAEVAPGPARATSGPKTKEQKRQEAEERNRRYREQQSGGKAPAPAPRRAPAGNGPADLQREMGRIEQEIAWKEKQKAELEVRLADPALYADAAKAGETNRRYAALQEEIAALYRAWETAASRLETA